MTQRRSDRIAATEDLTPHSPAPGERPEEVFEALLDVVIVWMNDSPEGIVDGGPFEESIRQKWRERFYAARRREGVIYEGDDD